LAKDLVDLGEAMPKLARQLRLLEAALAPELFFKSAYSSFSLKYYDVRDLP